MKHVGIDWSYSNAAFCCVSRGGEIANEDKIPADRDGLAKLVNELGTDVKACIEMMSGAAWVYDQLSSAGWDVEVADARKVKAIAPLACKTDKVDARVLAELCRRDLVPTVRVRPMNERELKEQVLLHMHLVQVRTKVKNRVKGLLTQFGLNLTLDRLRGKDYQKLLADQGVPAVWRASVQEAIELVAELDQRIDKLDKGLLPIARRDKRVKLLKTIPGLGDFLALAVAIEIGDIRRFSNSKKLISYSGLAPSIKQSGKSESTGPLSKAGSKLLRYAAVEAAQGAWRVNHPWHDLYVRVKKKYGKANPAKAAVARKILNASWHVLQRNEEFKVCRSNQADKTAKASSTCALAA